MLLQFSVENYLSFKEEQVLSLVPSVDKSHEENIHVRENNKALNVVAIYGANASGKSNLHKAITVALNMVRLSNSYQVDTKLPVVPFKFSDETIDKPSKFEFTFIAKDNKKYIYGFSATKDQITEEHLYRYGSQRPSVIFERTDCINYKFPSAQKKELEPIVRWNTPNKLFLSTATMWNAESTKSAYEWLSESFHSYGNLELLRNISLDMFRSDMETKKYIAFTKELLENTDINISNIDINFKKISDDDFRMNLIPRIVMNNQQFNSGDNYEFDISTEHTVKEDNKEKRYKLKLQDESLGTQQLFFFAPILKDVFDKGAVIFIDELDRSLHPFVVKYLVGLFRDEEINKNGAQLIATTHDTTLLDLDILRRDQIYFTDKNTDTGVSELYSLSDFSVRKEENIEKGYLLGRFGGVPYIKGEILI